MACIVIRKYINESFSLQRLPFSAFSNPNSHSLTFSHNLRIDWVMMICRDHIIPNYLLDDDDNVLVFCTF